MQMEEQRSKGQMMILELRQDASMRFHRIPCLAMPRTCKNFFSFNTVPPTVMRCKWRTRGEGTNDDIGAPPRRINALLLHPLLSESNNLQAFLFTSTHCHQLSCNADGGAEEQETDDDTSAQPRCLNALPPNPLLSDLQELLFSSTQ